MRTPILGLTLLSIASACTGVVSGNQPPPSGAVAGTPSGGASTGSGGTSTTTAPDSTPATDPRSGNQGLMCPTSGAPPQKAQHLARLTTRQYENTLRSWFPQLGGVDLSLPADQDVDGYTNRAQGQAPSSSLIQDLERNARAAASTLTQDPLVLTGCATPDVSCGKAYIERLSQKLLREYASTAATQRYASLFEQAAGSWTFGEALQVAISALLQAPEFVYRVEEGVAAAAEQDRPLRPSEVANRMAYFLWGAPPDDELVAAATAGKLSSNAEIRAQAERLVASPKAREAVADFHRQWLKMNKLRSHIETKSPEAFPSFTPEVADGLATGLEAFLDDAFFQGGLPSLLGGTFAYVNASTAPIYGLNASGNTLTRVELDPAQRAGLLTQAGLLAGMAHQSLQAPILRGVFVLDRLLCSPPPPPPPGIKTDVAPLDPSVPRTLRQVLEESHTVGACAGCHKFIDGIGYALGNYDALGRFQTMENGLPVDTSGALSGTFDADGPLTNGVELAQRLTPSAQVAQCLSGQWFAYSLGRKLQTEDGCAVSPLTDRLVASGGKLTDMLVAVTEQAAFRARPAFEAADPLPQ